jgi:hypothetical protein
MRSQTSQRMMQTTLALVLMLTLHLSARADTITFPTVTPTDPFMFTFNALASGKPSQNGGTPTSSIQNYMNDFMSGFATANGIAPPPTVVVRGAMTDRAYDGDDHVVGPCSPSTNGGNTCSGGSGHTGTVSPLTLGTSDFQQANGTPRADGSLDTFITNNTHRMVSSEPDTDRFSFAFSNLPAALFPGGVSFVGFDFEIFPDDQCTNGELTNLNLCDDTEFPDFSFYADSGNDNPTLSTSTLWSDANKVFHFWGFQPEDCDDNGRNAAFNAGQPAGQLLVCSPYRESQATDGSSGKEKVPQLIGSVFIALDTPATRFGFRDWPRTIGIDNFYMPPTSQTPEPGTLILLGTGLLAVGRKLRKRQDRKQNVA